METLFWAVITLFSVQCFFQPSKSCTYAAVVFTIGPAFHALAFGSYDGELGFLYYISGMIAATIVVILLSGVDPMCRLAIKLQKICMMFIAVDFAGLLLWAMGYASTLAEIASYALYLAAFISMKKWDRDDVVDHDSWLDCFCGFTHFFRRHFPKN
jgi:hypothetical protein